MNLPNDIVRQMNLILNEVAIKYATEGDYEKSILLLNRIIKIEVRPPRSTVCVSRRSYSLSVLSSLSVCMYVFVARYCAGGLAFCRL